MIDHPHMAEQQPFRCIKRSFKDRIKLTSLFRIKVKQTTFSYHVRAVFDGIPLLQHGNDGLIYTRVSTPYAPGTDHNMYDSPHLLYQTKLKNLQNRLKWKPPAENSIDFRLVLRFPSLRTDPNNPDFHAKPLFLLHAWCGGEGTQTKYEEYDEMYVEDDEWEKFVSSLQIVSVFMISLIVSKRLVNRWMIGLLKCAGNQITRVGA